MNDLRDHRVRGDLAAAAGEIRLAPGSAHDVMSTARRRTARRRRAGAVVAVAAIGGGSVLAIRQLVGGDDDSVQIQQPDGTTSDATTSDATTSGAGTVVEPVAPAPTSPPDAGTSESGATDAGAGDAGTTADIDPITAELVASSIVWRVVEPESAEAVGLIETAGPSSVSEVPGIHLSSAPGRSNDFRSQFWRSDDGITWQPIDLDLPFGRPERVRFDGSTVYQVGTAPGIAATEPNPLRFASSDDAGATWDEVVLPVDTNDLGDLPLVRSVGSGSDLVVDDVGVLVVTWANPQLDLEAVARTAGLPATDWSDAVSGILESGIDGLAVTVDPACEPWAPTTAAGPTEATVPFDPSGPVATIAIGPDDSAPSAVGGCEIEIIPWAELGVPQETVDAVFGPSHTRAFRIVDGEVTEIELPDDATWGGAQRDHPAFHLDDGTWVSIEGLDRLVPTDDPYASATGWLVGATADTEFRYVEIADGGAPFDGMPTLAVGATPVGTGAGAAVPTWADWRPVFGADVYREDHATGVTASGLIVAGRTAPDPYADAPATVSVDGITIRRSSFGGKPEFIDEATGDPIPLDRVGLATMQDEVVIGDGDGGEVARIPLRGEVAAVVYGGDASPVAENGTWFVASSADAVHVAVEPLAELLGVDDTDIRMIPRISTDGTTTVLAVTLNDTNPDGSYRQLVLVGTPAS